MCSLMSDLMISKFRKTMVIHDTECPYWDQVSLNNTNPTKPSLLHCCRWIQVYVDCAMRWAILLHCTSHPLTLEIVRSMMHKLCSCLSILWKSTTKPRRNSPNSSRHSPRNSSLRWAVTAQKATIQQLTTMLSTSESVIFPGHNHLTTNADDPTL